MSDANDMIPLVTGIVLGTMMRANARNGGILWIENIEPIGLDEVRVTFRSGRRVRIKVSDCTDEGRPM